MRNKIARWALIGLFCGFIALMGLGYLLLPKQDFSELEKRVLADFPEVSADTVLGGSFESGFETWMNDHIPGRAALVGANAYYELASGRNGLGGTVLANGRLYDAADPLDDAAISRKIEAINRFAEATGLPTDVLVIPSAGYMSEDSLPRHAAYHDGELADKLRAELSPGINLLWPEEALSGDVNANYYATDHHLTSLGSYRACKLYAQSLGLALPEPEGYDVETYPGFRGSMYSQSGLWGVRPDDVELWRSKSLGPVTVRFDDREGSDSLFFPEHLSELDMYPTFLDGNHGLVTIETGNEGGENLLLIRDSYGHCFAPFAADCFHRIVLVDLRYYRQPVTELAQAEDIDRTLLLYGADTFLTDVNFGWLR